MTNDEANNHKAKLFDAARELVIALTELAKLAQLAVTIELDAAADRKRQAK